MNKYYCQLYRESLLKRYRFKNYRGVYLKPKGYTKMFMFSIIMLNMISYSYSFEAEDKATLSTKNNKQQAPIKVALDREDPIVRLIFDKLALQLELDITYTSYQSLKKALKAVEIGEQDFIGNIAYSKDRSLRYEFSYPTNIKHHYWISRAPLTQNTTQIKSQNILGKVIAFNPDIIDTERFKKLYPHVNFIHYEFIDDAEKLLDSGQVDLVMTQLSKESIKLSQRYNTLPIDSELSITPVSIISKKGTHKHLIKQFEEKISSDEFQQAINNKRHNIRYNLQQANIQQQVKTLDLNTNKTFQIKLEKRAPFTYFQEGKITGLAAEIITKSCKIINIKCNLINTENESWDSMHNSFLNKEIDAIAPYSVTSDRQNKTYFSNAIYQGDMVIIKREGFRNNVYTNVYELFFEKIGVIDNGFSQILFNKIFPRKKLHVYKNIDALYAALLHGEIDYTTATKSAINARLKSDNSLSLVYDKSIGSIEPVLISIGFQKNEEGLKLAKLFNLAFNMVNIDKLQQKYTDKDDYQQRLRRQKQREVWVWASFICIATGLILILLKFRINSMTDDLTRLGNRRKLKNDIPNKLNDTQSLIYLKIQRFKEINDLYGQSESEHILKSIACALPKIFTTGQYYSVNTNAFFIIGNYSKNQRIEIFKQLSEIIIKPLNTLEPHKINCNIVYFKNATSHQNTDDLENIIYIAMDRLIADQNKILLEINNDVVKEIKQIMTFRKDLYNAVKNKELTAYLQPIIDLKNKNITGIEGLSRWVYQGKVLTPYFYFDDLAVLRLEAELDFIMIEILDDVFQELSKKQLISNSFKLNINITSKSLRQSKRLFQYLEKLKTPAQNICIEILEDTIINDEVFNTIKHLTSMGFQVAIDDFGAGFVSIEHLKSPHISKVKLDRSLFPINIIDSDIDLKALYSLVDFLNNFSKEIVMEGVETKQQAEFLLTQNINFAQGYFFAKPMPLDDLKKLLKKDDICKN